MFGIDLTDLGTWGTFFFFASVLAVLTFEFVNGFHDTANAVATVIYTKALKPKVAVIWSGIMNFAGMITSKYVFGLGVAMGIIKLLPLTEMMNIPAGESIALVLAIVIGAIIWNLGTWYFGIPCSSSHTLVGSLLGAGLGFQMIHGGDGVNWDKAKDIGMSLLMSPAFGFTMAIFLIFIFKKVYKRKDLFKEPEGDNPPPFGIRVLLIITCSLVSFFHGSNDGQKGLGLLLVILMTFLPMQYALHKDFGDEKTMSHLTHLEQILVANKTGASLEKEFEKSILTITEIKESAKSIATADKKEKFKLRKKIQSLTKSLELITKDPELLPDAKVRSEIKGELKSIKKSIEFTDDWAIMLIALSIGLGTMIGWKRIVVTIGEKIGKSHLTYAQGASAELIASLTIGLSTWMGLPVSTTHVLSSGVAGTMVATGGVKNLQKSTVVNIGLAWLLTLPVTILLAMGLFLLLRLFA
ncbi:MAG: inorganic phosphate transporter [Chitinophagales bacterium]|nr:inorganic phosphate transporter [Chitinophagales bacterium]